MIGEDKIYTDTVTSTQGAYWTRKFSKALTDTGKWHLCSEMTVGDIAFSITTLPAGSIIDVHLGWTGWATGSAVATLSSSGLTAGRIYRNALDNTTASGGVGGGTMLGSSYGGGSYAILYG